MFNHQVRRVLLAMAYMGAILWMSSVPGTLSDDATALHRVFVWVAPSVQNLMHVPVYAGLAFLWCRVLDLRLPRLWCVLGSFLIVSSFGVIDEWFQSFVPGRFASVGDVIANALGAAIGIGVFLYVSNRNSKKVAVKDSQGRARLCSRAGRIQSLERE